MLSTLGGHCFGDVAYIKKTQGCNFLNRTNGVEIDRNALYYGTQKATG